VQRLRRVTPHRIASGGTHTAETDLQHAAEALPDNTVIPWWQRWIARHANLLTGTTGQDNARSDGVSAIAPTLLAWLTVADRLPESVDLAELSPLLPTPYLSTRWGLTPPPDTLVRVLTGHTGLVYALAWSPEGTHLACAGNDGQVLVHDLEGGRTTRLRLMPPSCLAWSAAGIAVGGSSGVVVLDLNDHAGIALWSDGHP